MRTAVECVCLCFHALAYSQIIVIRSQWVFYLISEAQYNSFHASSSYQDNSKVLLDLLPKHRDAVLKKLPTTLPIHITAPLVVDEGYWERCSRARWEVCDVSVYGGCWKRFFFERHVQHLIENFVPESTDDTELKEALKLSCGLIRRLDIRQLLPPVKVESSVMIDDDSEDSYVEEDSHHMDLGMVIKLLPNLEELSVTYGVRDCGMNFEWKIFKFTSTDCLMLSHTVAGCKTLRVVRVRRSQMDDAKMRVFIRNLLDHPSLEELDLSTNIIGDHGARALCMLLKSRCKLVKLNLCDNQIKGTGAQALAHALTRNTSLRYLNLRHNHIGDEGGQALCRGLAKNATLLELNLSSNDMGESTAILLSQMVTINSTLKSLDLSCNRLGLVSCWVDSPVRCSSVHVVKLKDVACWFESLLSQRLYSHLHGLPGTSPWDNRTGWLGVKH